MGAPVIFNGSRSKLLTSSGLLTQQNQPLDYNGPLNLILNSSGSNSSTTGWATYANSVAGPIPETGSGGTATGISITATASSIPGDTALTFLKSGGSNSQGSGISYDFRAPLVQKGIGGVIAVEVPYSPDSVPAVGDWVIYVYDITHSKLVSPMSTPSVIGPSAGRALVYFNLDKNTEYARVIFHYASTSTSATSFYASNIYVGPQKTVVGLAGSDWTPYSPVLTNLGTGATAALEWMRVGGSVVIKGSVTIGTSPPASEARIGLPSVTSAGTSKIPALQAVSSYFKDTSSSTHGGAVLIEPSVTYFTLGSPDAFSSGTTNAVSKVNGDEYGAGLTLKINPTIIPIEGWTAGLTMASDPGAQPIVVRAQGTPGSTGAGSILVLGTEDIDSAGGYDPSTGRFTAPVAGYYSLSAFISMVNTAVQVAPYINGTTTGRTLLQSGASASYGESGAMVVYLNRGDILDIRPDGTTGTINQAIMSIERVTGSTTLALDPIRSEIWVHTGDGRGGTSSGDTQIRNFATVVKSTGAAITRTARTATTGEFYTINESGLYAIQYADILASATWMGITLNDTQTSTTYPSMSTYSQKIAATNTPAADVVASVSTTLFLSAGDIIRAKCSAATGGGGGSGLGGDQFRITKIGN